MKSRGLPAAFEQCGRRQALVDTAMVCQGSDLRASFIPEPQFPSPVLQRTRMRLQEFSTLGEGTT